MLELKFNIFFNFQKAEYLKNNIFFLNVEFFYNFTPWKVWISSKIFDNLSKFLKIIYKKFLENLNFFCYLFLVNLEQHSKLRDCTLYQFFGFEHFFLFPNIFQKYSMV